MDGLFETAAGLMTALSSEPSAWEIMEGPAKLSRLQPGHVEWGQKY